MQFVEFLDKTQTRDSDLPHMTKVHTLFKMLPKTHLKQPSLRSMTIQGC